MKGRCPIVSDDNLAATSVLLNYRGQSYKHFFIARLVRQNTNTNIICFLHTKQTALLIPAVENPYVCPSNIISTWGYSIFLGSSDIVCLGKPPRENVSQVFASTRGALSPNTESNSRISISPSESLQQKILRTALLFPCPYKRKESLGSPFTKGLLQTKSPVQSNRYSITDF